MISDYKQLVIQPERNDSLKRDFGSGRKLQEKLERKDEVTSKRVIIMYKQITK